MEFAPFSDLSAHFLSRGGFSSGVEERVKTVGSQIVAAVDFLHSFRLVHRDIRMENVMVFRKDLSLVKLGDFGHTLPTGTPVLKTKGEFTASTVYGVSSPPEVKIKFTTILDIIEIDFLTKFYKQPNQLITRELSLDF